MADNQEKQPIPSIDLQKHEAKKIAGSKVVADQIDDTRKKIKQSGETTQILSETLKHINGINKAAATLDSDNIDRETLIDLIKDGFSDFLSYGNWFEYAQEIKNQLPDIFDSLISSPEMKEKIKSRIEKAIGRDDFSYSVVSRNYYPDHAREKCKQLKEQAEFFHFSDEEFLEIIKNGIANQLGNNVGSLHYPIEGVPISKIILKFLPLDESDYSEAVQKGLLQRLNAPIKENFREGNNQAYEDISYILASFPLSAETLTDPVLQAAMVKRVKEHGISVESILKLGSFPLPAEIFSLQTVQISGVNKISHDLRESVRAHPQYSDRVDKSIKLAQRFHDAGVDIASDPKIMEEAQKVLVMRLRGKYKKSWYESSYTYKTDEVIKIVQHFAVSDEFLSSTEYLEALKEYVTNLLKKGAGIYSSDPSQDIIRFSEEFNLVPLLKDEDVQSMARDLFVKKSIKGNVGVANQILKVFNISVEEVSEAINEELIANFEQNKLERAKDIIEIFSIKQDELERLIAPYIKKNLEGGELDKVISVKESFSLNDEIYEAVTWQELFGKNIDLQTIVRFRLLIGLDPMCYPAEARELINIYKLGSLVATNLEDKFFSVYRDEIEKRIGSNGFNKYFDDIKDIIASNQEVYLTESDLEWLEKNEQNNIVKLLTFAELNTLAAKNGLEQYDLSTNEEAERVYNEIKEKTKDWQDPEINRRFEEGAELFGYHRMLAFAKTGQRHDALYGFERILELQKASGLKAERFYHNILQQVAMDAGTYGEYGDTAFQTLNSIAQGFQDNIEETLVQAREIKGIPQLDVLVANLKRPQDVFSSWKMLIQYKELVSLLERREILDELSREENPRLRGYVSTLLFHPSVTDTYAVKLFWQRPYDFFELESSHTSRELHDLKKPTNYVRIPNLDLAPAELRDALVDGALDKIQVWQPLEATYELPSNPRAWEQYQEFSQKSLSAILQETLGPESKGVKNKKKLFGKIRTLIEAQLDPEQFPQTRRVATRIVQRLVGGEEVPEITLSPEAQKEIRDAVYFGNFGYSKKMKTTKYRVKINLKSNPDGVVAGNDTQCCMPFGDGKNTLYTYNPICALMTVQRETGRGEYRTIAQSVLTKDKDVKAQIADIRGRFEEIESGQVDMTDLLPQDILHQEQSYVACDSVEVANNYQTPEYSELLANLYRDFLREYVARFGEDQHLDPKKAVLGSCTYALATTTSESNTFLPESPVAYSDKYGESVDVLSLEQTPETFFVRRNIDLAEIERVERTPIQNPQIEYLSYQDSLETAYIEGKAYEGTTLKQGVAEMENALIAKDINNAAKGRANMSLKYVTSDGQMQAYLVAYEGEYGYGFEEEYEDEYHEEEETEREPCIYVMDIAKLLEVKKGVGMELIGEFIRLYQENYIKKEKLTPIRAEAREVSSYKLIMRHLDTWGRSIGIKFELEEGESYQKEEDTIHPVVIRPIRVEV